MPLLPRVPPIRVRGVRQVVPTGHVVGRLNAGDGAAELIPFAALGGALIAGGGVGPTPKAQYDTLGFTAPGLFSDGQIFTLAAETPSNGTIFPSKMRLSTATFGFAPAGNVVFYLVQNLAVFLAMGAPNGAIARLNGTGSSMTGTITWAAIAKYMAASANGALNVVISQDALVKGMAKFPNGLNWNQLMADFKLIGG